MRTRFAPSPTGWLHLGHVRAAHEAFAFEGETWLRIEDTDHTRCRPEYTQGIFEDLQWLGFSWPTPVRVQSEHMAAYAAVAERLRDLGVLYPCDLTRREVAERTIDGIFRGRAVPGPDAPWRLDVRRAARLTGPLSFTNCGERHDVDLEAVSDDILVRRDTGTSYHIATAHDDALQGMTHIVRGRDLLEATPIQRIIQALMGWPEPQYRHHGLVMDGKRKLSKRDGDASVRGLREAGVSAAEVLEMAGGLSRT